MLKKMAKCFGFAQVNVEEVILWAEILEKLNGLGRGRNKFIL